MKIKSVGLYLVFEWKYDRHRRQISKKILFTVKWNWILSIRSSTTIHLVFKKIEYLNEIFTSLNFLVFNYCDFNLLWRKIGLEFNGILNRLNSLTSVLLLYLLILFMTSHHIISAENKISNQSWPWTSELDSWILDMDRGPWTLLSAGETTEMQSKVRIVRWCSSLLQIIKCGTKYFGRLDKSQDP